MSKKKPKYTPRGYQSFILDRVDDLKASNLLIELDCGLGKRFITHQLVKARYPDKRFIIVVHSSSSLAETIDYLRSEYGGIEDELGEISSRVPSGRRPYVLKEKRVVVATPQVLASMARKDVSLFEPFDIILINEVDTLVRRTAGRTALVFPWPLLLMVFRGKQIIGMSGTLRDDHAVFSQDQLEIRKELNTLKKHIQDAELISMEDLYGTDIEDYLEPTLISIGTVSDQRIRSISIVLDELIRNTRQEIADTLKEDDNLEIIDGDARRIHLMLERLPVPDDLKSRYSSLLMLRKYVYAMPPKQFLKMFHNPHVKPFFNISDLRRVLPEISAKTLKVLDIAKKHKKALVLTSYLEMVSQIQTVLQKAGLSVLTVTGHTRDKGEVLQRFRTDASIAAMVMSPVGERDLDIPHADVMVICDTINTSKTMYQKMKRTRGGLVILLAYSGTSEEMKVNRLLQRILERYPWSTAIVGPQADMG